MSSEKREEPSDDKKEKKEEKKKTIDAVTIALAEMCFGGLLGIDRFIAGHPRLAVQKIIFILDIIQVMQIINKDHIILEHLN